MTAPTAFSPVAPRDARPGSTLAARARRVARGALQLLVGALVAGGLAALLLRPVAPPAPPGFRIYRPPHELSALALVGDTLWAGGSDGLTFVDTTTREVVGPPPDAPRLRAVRGLAVESAGAVWVAHGGGLTRHDPARGEWRTFGPAEGALGGAVAAVLVDHAGGVWAGGERGLARFDDGAWRVLGPSDWPNLDSISALYESAAGEVWVGSYSPNRGGLARLSGGAWRLYGTADGLAHNSVNAIRADAAGDLWVATGFADLGGASRLRAGEWTSLRRADGLAGGKVRSLFFEPTGRAWFGSEYDGIAVFDGDRRRVLRPADGLAGVEVKSMLRDAGGAYWLATEDGLTRIAPAALGD